MWAQSSVEIQFVPDGSETAYSPIRLEETLPIETLPWIKIIFVRIFAAGQFNAQRKKARDFHREMLHEAFIKFLSGINRGSPNPSSVHFVKLLLQPCEVYTLKRRFLLGFFEIQKRQKMAQTRYLPVLTSSFSKCETAHPHTRHVLNLIQTYFKQV